MEPRQQALPKLLTTVICFPWELGLTKFKDYIMENSYIHVVPFQTMGQWRGESPHSPHAGSIPGVTPRKVGSEPYEPY